MPLEIIKGSHPLYNKVLGADGNIQTTNVDDTLANYEHARFIAKKNGISNTEYEKAVFNVVSQLEVELANAKKEHDEVHGTLMVFKYDPHPLFDHYYISPLKEGLPFKSRVNMFDGYADRFVTAIKEVAVSKQYHDGAMLVDPSGNFQSACTDLDYYRRAIERAYSMKYFSETEPDLWKMAGFEGELSKTGGGKRKQAAICMSLLMLDSLIALNQEDDFKGFVFKNGHVIRHLDQDIDYAYHLERLNN